MRQLLLTVQYCGSAYHGFQVQKNARTLAAAVQDAVERVFGARLDVKGCSRTDAGVHARCFALTLRTDWSILCDAVVRAMNINLPEDIAVLACREVADDFHPRYSCVGKRYVYEIWNARVKNPFLVGRALHYPAVLDLSRMDAAAKTFLGTHDFSAFCAAGSTTQDRVRTISQAFVRKEGDLVRFTVTGSGFLYNMVRIITGTLLEVSRGGIEPKEIAAILAGKDRSRAGATAPAHGLYLDQVFYPDGPLWENESNLTND